LRPAAFPPRSSDACCETPQPAPKATKPDRCAAEGRESPREAGRARRPRSARKCVLHSAPVDFAPHFRLPAGPCPRSADDLLHRFPTATSPWTRRSPQPSAGAHRRPIRDRFSAGGRVVQASRHGRLPPIPPTLIERRRHEDP
jgi:hypothetical protein